MQKAGAIVERTDDVNMRCEAPLAKGLPCVSLFVVFRNHLQARRIAAMAFSWM